MKKVLVLVLAAILVLSFAAVSMAEVKVKADCRYELVEDPSKSNRFYDNPDVRIGFEGKISDTLSYWANTRCQMGESGTINSSGVSKKSNFFVDEYYFTYNTKFATIKLGDFDYKVIPSRVLIKPYGYNVVPRADGYITANIPVGKELYVNTLYTIDGVSGTGADPLPEDGAYAVTVGYKTKVFGVECSYYDTKNVSSTKSGLVTGYSIDSFYQLNDTIKLTLFGNNPNKLLDGVTDPKMLMCAGVVVDKIMGQNLKVSMETALAKDETDSTNEYTPYALQVVYGMKNGLGIEYELTNSSPSRNKNVLRFRVKY